MHVQWTSVIAFVSLKVLEIPLILILKLFQILIDLVGRSRFQINQFQVGIGSLPRIVYLSVYFQPSRYLQIRLKFILRQLPFLIGYNLVLQLLLLKTFLVIQFWQRNGEHELASRRKLRIGLLLSSLSLLIRLKRLLRILLLFTKRYAQIVFLRFST